VSLRVPRAASLFLGRGGLLALFVLERFHIGPGLYAQAREKVMQEKKKLELKKQKIAGA